MSNAVVSTSQWTSLSLLQSQFDANLAVLRRRDPELAGKIVAAAPAEPHFLLATDDRVTLAKQVGQTLQGLPNPVPPVAAQQICEKLFPAGPCSEAVMVAGIDQGWIWDALYRLDAKAAHPFHRPPLYFLAHDVSKLWLTLHVQDWSQLLADERVTLFIGADAARQYRDHLLGNARLPLPRLSLTVEPAIWQNGDPTLASADVVYNTVLTGWDAKLQTVLKSLESGYPPITATTIAQRIAAGQTLRVLGITSRYTTFLQHSMRDWLAAFDAMGHATSLVIEQADHQTMNNVVYLSQVAEFQPDLILIIDHYRAEYRGLPAGVPVVMWVQDRLPNIFCEAGGAAQGERDFCVGFGRKHLAQKYGYPIDRFLTAPVGINDARFAPGRSSAADLAKFACEASFVSHHSVPAEQQLAEQLQQITQPECKRLFVDVFERMRAHYETQREVLIDATIRKIINTSAASLGLSIEPPQMATIEGFFRQQIANSLFRHTALKWVADAGVDLHLYGRGWEKHPTLGKYARGTASNESELVAIYEASKINLQITPFGAMHQRLLDGLACGAFFLVRWSQGDLVGRRYRPLWNAIVTRGIADEAELAQRIASDAELATLAADVRTLEGEDFKDCGFSLYDVAQAHADSDFMLSAGSVWDGYDDIAFATAEECARKLQYFLSNDAARTRVATTMRAAVIERASYRAINTRLLQMIGQQLSPAAERRAAA